MLKSQFPDFDPWGQASTVGEGIVMALNEKLGIDGYEIGELEKELGILNYEKGKLQLHYRFSHKELIDHYLWNKALDRDSAVQAIDSAHLLDSGFCFTGFSARRSNDRTWSIKAKVGINTKKTLVFYEGRVPQGKWTPWVIHEYTLPHTLPSQKGHFLCKLKKKDDEKAGISSGEGQPSNVVEDKPFDNPSVIDVGELLAHINDSIEVEHGDDSVYNSQIDDEHVPVSFRNAAYAIDDFDGVHNQSRTNEQNDRIYVESSSMQFCVYEESVLSLDDFSFFRNCNGNGYEIQHQSRTNEQDSEIQHQPSTAAQDDEIQHQQHGIDEQDDEIQHQPDIDERYDEFFNSVLVNDNELFSLCENDDFLLG
ncbi:hypothetical protein F3Y22_tig00112738pilonHSYRG01053 [Hibiscus syriacus]|uniref:NAC domain-containing protein n=1 Tax=Hibiscus syriacus TaxID=106335 RepID=A0A6A2WU38_HIBSY|nr:hypothetical protein F3Y22_tig00112738pilonHSYRG01053 [Hibiscus syriacus]